MRKLALALTLALASLPAFAADNPWAGTWKLDPAKSQFTGDTFTLTKTAAGMHWSNGAKLGYDFTLDGKEYPTLFGSVGSSTSDGPTSYTSISKRNGTTLGTHVHTLSADGQTMTIHSTGTKPDGTEYTEDDTYKRLSGTTGFEGKWQSTKVDVSAPGSWVISFPQAKTIHWEIPDYKEVVEGKLDGTDLPVSGPTAPKGMALAIKQSAPNKLTYTVKVEGKPIAYGVSTLAADGKSVSDVSWDAGKESEKQTAYFAKQ